MSSCPYFVEARHCRCTAVAGHVVPSLHEREAFCRTDLAESCPTYRAREATGAPLSEAAYYQLWIIGRVHEVHAPPPAM